MIVISGAPRTGTSLMMQTLRLLGVPIVGYDYHKEFSNRELNPNGYWDLPLDETINGIADDGYAGKAIKLFGLQLFRTNIDCVKALIICHRKKENALPSIKRLIESEMWQLEKWGLDSSDATCERAYDANYAIIWDFVLNKSKCPTITVQYENMLEKPIEEITRIAEFVGSDADTKNAIQNVRR